MDTEFRKLIDEAIHMELNIGELYLLFYRQFPDESQFWWELVIEEENHAALLKTVKQMGSADVDIPRDMLPEGLEELIKSNLVIQKAYEDFKNNPDRDRAFRFAYRIETSAGELHYNAFMKNAPDSTVTDIFKRLNGDDVDHAERIRQYMIKHQIPATE